MKTEMKMLANGNYERIVIPIQHECKSKDHSWICREYAQKKDKLFLEIHDGDPYEDGYQNKIEVSFCPFCGYGINKNIQQDFFPPPWNPSEYPEKTQGWIEFQKEMKKDPKYYIAFVDK